MPWQQSMGIIIHPLNQGGSSLRGPLLGAIPSIMFQAGQYVINRAIPWYGEKLCLLVVYSTSFPALLVGRPAAVRACPVQGCLAIWKTHHTHKAMLIEDTRNKHGWKGDEKCTWQTSLTKTPSKR